jgi:HPt (histidine-containing phosphotransfer) domain-containing protein
MEALPIVDRERLSIVSRGNAERGREFFGALVEDAQAAYVQLQDALAAGDDHALHELAHSLKGMALEVGAPRVAAAATALEAQRDPALQAVLVDAVGTATAELRDVLPTL